MNNEQKRDLSLRELMEHMERVTGKPYELTGAAAMRRSDEALDRHHTMSRQSRRMIDDNVARGYENLEKISRMSQRRPNPMTDEDFDGEMEVPPCPACGGQLMVLGQLGSLMHYRCRQCGGQFQERQERKPNPEHAEVWVISIADHRDPMNPRWKTHSVFSGTRGYADAKLRLAQQAMPSDVFSLRKGDDRSRHDFIRQRAAEITSGSHRINPHEREQFWVIMRETEIGWMPVKRFEGTRGYAQELLERYADNDDSSAYTLAEDRQNARLAQMENDFDDEGASDLRDEMDSDGYEENPTQAEADAWVGRYTDWANDEVKRTGGEPSHVRYLIRVTMKNGDVGYYQRRDSRTRRHIFDTNPSLAKAYNNAGRAQEAATKILSVMKDDYPERAATVKTLEAIRSDKAGEGKTAPPKDESKTTKKKVKAKTAKKK